MPRARKRAYSTAAMSYAKEVIANYDSNRAKLDAAIEDAAYTYGLRKSTITDMPSGNSATPPNPTLKAALSLDEPEFAQIALQVRAVEHTIDQLSPEHFDLFIKHFSEHQQPADTYERNVRDFILQLVCMKLGMPERGS